MKKAIAVLAVLSLAAFAGQVAVDLDPVQGTDDIWLQYDDGTPGWMTWDGMYRGVWFNIQDFIPGMTSFQIGESAFWFYHHADYPWDTSDVYLEIWDGYATAPTAQLDQTLVTAIHYAPVYLEYTPPLITEQNFWALANTELSAGGWPAILADGTPGVHSFFSDDFIIWESWGEMGDYFITLAPPGCSLDNSTWGSLKATF